VEGPQLLSAAVEPIAPAQDEALAGPITKQPGADHRNEHGFCFTPCNMRLMLTFDFSL
jgi:hypothetical protein